jgi:peroxidase
MHRPSCFIIVLLFLTSTICAADKGATIVGAMEANEFFAADNDDVTSDETQNGSGDEPTTTSSSEESSSSSNEAVDQMENSDVDSLLPFIPVPHTIKQDCFTDAEEAPEVSLHDPFSGTLPECAQSRFRSFDGTCNNIAFPSRGSTNSILLRLLEPDYADLIGVPRKSKHGLELPGARIVVKRLSGNLDIQSQITTHLFVELGQFIDHDLTNTKGTTRGANDQPPKCCPEESGHSMDIACFPISIPADDDAFSPPSRRCLEFVRNFPASRPGCSSGPREQVNMNTAYIDGSAIYGLTEEMSRSLRSMENGQLKIFTPNDNSDYHLLPQDNPMPPFNPCIPREEPKKCFKAGDERVNEQLGLTFMHTLWLRQHNLVARKLMELNPSWDDEQLFQEARHIIAAQLQHIIFNEFHTVLLGDQIIEKWGLKLLESGRLNNYDISVTAGCLNEFSHAAYRVGHTLVPKQITRPADKSVLLRTTFFQPFSMYDKNVFDEIVFGMISTPAMEVDNNFVEDLRSHLYEVPDHMDGQDLISRNIQRGRDHGLAGWMKWRRHCGLTTAANFVELKKMQIMPDIIVDGMADIYQDIADVDLFIAGVSENHVPGGIIGPTFACIIADQFRRLRMGDRFWYENDLPLPSSLSDEQVQAIRGITIARIICDNTPSLEAIQPSALRLSDPSSNPMTPCDAIPKFNYDPWQQMSADPMNDHVKQTIEIKHKST